MKKDAKIVLLLVSALLMTGAVAVYSSSAVHAYQRYGDSMYFFKRHVFFIFTGIVAALICMKARLRALSGNSRWILAAFLVLLFLVLIPGIGVASGGARRWIRVLGLGFQPSEGAKIALIIYIADFTSRKRHVLGNFAGGFLPPVAVTLLMASLVLAQPDMGTAVSIVFIGFLMLFCSGVKLRHIAAISAPVIPALILAVLMKPYRMRRVVTFLDPWSDRTGAGFQLVQSFIALGSGGIAGVGLGQSKQKLFYLPEAHTDFIFSIIGEETGFIGATLVLMTLTALIFYIFRIAMRIEERFSSSVVMGVGIMISFEVLVNVGVSTGLLPTKGLPLPFLSYGGSSMLFNLAAIGLILNMSRLSEKGA